MYQEIKAALRSGPKTCRQIAEETGYDPRNVGTTLRRIEAYGLVEMEGRVTVPTGQDAALWGWCL